MSQPAADRLITILSAACIGTLVGSGPAHASSDEARNAQARTDCVRGKFADSYLQGRGGDPPPDYSGQV